jgi:ATP-dependent helicase/DNAse subunit B
VQFEAGGKKFLLRGRFDRVDLMENNAVVIDYKTGGISENSLTKLYREIYHGQKIQLPVYLTALEAIGYNPSGAFYIPVKDSFRQDGVTYKAYGIASANDVEDDDFNLGFSKKCKTEKERLNAIKNYCNLALPVALNEILFEPLLRSPVETCANCVYKPVCSLEGEENAREGCMVGEEQF